MALKVIERTGTRLLGAFLLHLGSVQWRHLRGKTSVMPVGPGEKINDAGDGWVPWAKLTGFDGHVGERGVPGVYGKAEVKAPGDDRGERLPALETVRWESLKGSVCKQ